MGCDNTLSVQIIKYSNRNYQSNYAKNVGGFTLIELMISLVLGLLISAAVIQVYIVNTRTVTIQQSASEVQDSTIFALQSLEDHIRIANLGNPITSISDTTNHGGIVLTSTNLGSIKPTEASSYYSVKVDGTEISVNGADNCLSTGVIKRGEKFVLAQTCSMNQLAARDTLLVKQMAREENIELAVVRCPADIGQQVIQQHMCIVTAWNGTKPLLVDNDKGNNSNACADSKGIYKIGSQCLISEAY